MATRLTRIANFLAASFESVAHADPRTKQMRTGIGSRMALTSDYSLLSSSRRIAIQRDVYREAMDKFGEDLPFDNLFEGGDTTRIVLPFENEIKYKISKALGKTGELGEKGFDSIDWKTSEAVKIFPPGPQAPPGTPPQERRTKIGKAISRLSNGVELLNWWSKNKDAAKTDEYAIVVSRHPVDVIRMSDHEDIESCHSPGEGHWHHCVSEMKHGGLVTYLVNKGSIRNLQPEEIAGKKEIFYDQDRGIKGVVPLSRLRVRRFTHRRDGFDLAIPEEAMYGQENSAFLKQIQDWARSSQTDLTKQKRWRMSEFARRGGAYTDTDDGDLFNIFFGDTLDHGKTEFGMAGEEEDAIEAVNDQRTAEIEAIHERWQARFKYCSTSYDENNYDDEDQPITFNWSGSMGVEFDANVFPMESTEAIHKNLNSGRESLSDWFSNHSIYFGDGYIDFSVFHDKAVFGFSISTDDSSGDPDGYNDFCHYIENDFDTEYDKIKGIIFEWLQEHEFIPPSPVRLFDPSDLEFEHFKVDLEGGHMRAIAEAPIGKHDIGMWNNLEFREHANQAIRGIVSKELQRVLRLQKNTSEYLPGIEQETHPVAVKESYNLSNFGTYVKPLRDHYEQLAITIEFQATDLTTEEDFNEVIDLMTVVDRIFPRIAKECSTLLEMYYYQKYKLYNRPKLNRRFEFDPKLEAGVRRR